MVEPEIDNLGMIEQDDETWISWHTKTDFEYLAAVGDYVKVCTEDLVYDRGRVIAIRADGFDMDTGVGLIFKKVSLKHDDVIYIEKLGGPVL